MLTANGQKTLCEMCVRVCPLNLNWVESSKPYWEASSLPRCDDCSAANVGPQTDHFPFVIICHLSFAIYSPGVGGLRVSNCGFASPSPLRFRLLTRDR